MLVRIIKKGIGIHIGIICRSLTSDLISSVCYIVQCSRILKFEPVECHSLEVSFLASCKNIMR